METITPAEILETSFSLKDYTLAAVPAFVEGAKEKGVGVYAAVVFGSAVNPRPESHTVKTNPDRWDVDVFLMVDNVEYFRQNPESLVPAIHDELYAPVAKPSSSTVEFQEIGARHFRGPKYGLHIQMVEINELLRGNFDSLDKKALETGVLIGGEIPAELQTVCQDKNVKLPIANSDQIAWSSLKKSVELKPVIPGSKRLI